MRDAELPVVKPYIVESKPATEWLMGTPVEKVSPRYAHSVSQRMLTTVLAEWARGRGRVGPEWRFWVTPTGEIPRYLVPDVAYLSYDRLSREDRDAAEEPRVAPDVAVEIRSPDDRNILVLHKIDVYLRAGTSLVVLVDPLARRIELHDAERAAVLHAGDALEHPALPGFAFALDTLFAELDA